MPKYYTVCDMTPSRADRYDRQHQRVYPSAPRGFLFYDSEGLEPQQLRKAMWSLLGTISEDNKPEGAIPALFIPLDECTVAATFSLRAFPSPIRYGKTQYYNRHVTANPGTEWLSVHGADLEAAVVTDITNPLSRINYVNPNALYDQCTELMRLTGLCPCDLEGAKCRSENVLPSLKEITEEQMLYDFFLDKEDVRFARYKHVAGFEYASPATTTLQDFETGNRPWDAHDFTAVEARRAEYKVRGNRQSVDYKKRTLECSECAFQTMQYDGTSTDCGWVRNCTGPVSVEQAYEALQEWYDESGYENMRFFTAAQRDYLMLKGGEEVRAKICGATRRIKATYGGFLRTGYGATGGWTYRLSAHAGDISRHEDFKSYADLRSVLPELPEQPTVEPLDYKVKLAAASLGAWPHVYVQYKGSLTTHHMCVNNSYVRVDACNTSYMAGHRGITLSDGPKAFVAQGPLTYGSISKAFNS